MKQQRREQLEKRKSEEKTSRHKIKAHEKVGKSRNSVFFSNVLCLGRSRVGSAVSDVRTKEDIATVQVECHGESLKSWNVFKSSDKQTERER